MLINEHLINIYIFSSHHPTTKTCNDRTANMKVLVSALLVALAAANRDDAYYVGGIASPNQGERMYWGDSLSVLQDLSQFDALYVTYHNCA